ncbi:hypothetical protein PUNSTDRAFT_101046 [Punctularia strigosozonata HHB-11173 SS5]|uniref:uncharacterized protein n=1 Tax=Punctularia strigosozonata (strain HHB-11173) TaxID=741275 RepID=UPI000441868B|nr:uncharacterized protein PUNSTDRAFT_101046 [Punctularia strigosozonata HHB-11173 SS5]EIN11057.1 hypothetical protein PUNSTDRAFT_101046 [Punctularia strigosozonata HHB-11173 SS5]
MLPRASISRLPCINVRTRARILVYYGLRATSSTSGSSTSPDADGTSSPAPARASDKLFADAAREEAELVSNPPRPPKLPLEVINGGHPNWTGEESMEDAVLRMLMDKYKPMRTGNIRSAEDKIRAEPPKVAGRATEEEEVELSMEETIALAKAGNSAAEAGGSVVQQMIEKVEGLDTVPRVQEKLSPAEMANVPLLQPVEGHRPWMTTYKAPSHVASVRVGHFPSLRTSPTKSIAPGDEKALKKARELKKRTQVVTRLTDARERTLDYRLGMRHPGGGAGGGRANPSSLKGWASLVEEKIESARQAGHFNKISGRGKPIKRHDDEGNPFIAREEFLMNRIVQRNGAAPPWVELQHELESTLDSFREILLQSWTRRAVRNITASTPPAFLPSTLRKLASSPNLSAATSLRDSSWEQQEKSYHDAAIKEINDAVRRYNGIAPYAVRRAYHDREQELRRCYERCGEAIVRELEERIKVLGKESKRVGWTEDAGLGQNGGPQVEVIRIRDVLRGWVQNLARRFGARSARE